VALHDAQVRAFIDLEFNVPVFGAVIDHDLQRYIGILRSWMRGNLDWAISSGRYLAAMLEVDIATAARHIDFPSSRQPSITMKL
jgi:hypothetical protein